MHYLILSVLCFALVISSRGEALTSAQRLEIALETLNRIESDPATNATVRAALDAVLKEVQGTPDFVRLVKKFNLKDQADGLLAAARRDPSGETGVDAMRLLLSDYPASLLGNALADAATSLPLVAALGNTREKAAVPILVPFLTNTTFEVPFRRSVLRALVQTPEGAETVINLARSGDLPGDLRLAASESLHSVRWPEVKAMAEEWLPRAKTRLAEPLPPLEDLVRMTGSKSNGETIYFNETAGCANCHQVKGRGQSVGPDLSRIGSKLAREALFEAILEPNAGVSLGYEAHLVELKSGDEAYGLLASETETELAIKDLNGIVTSYRKADIATHVRLSTSIMPSGLTENLSTQELVDLVDFLQSLKAP